MGRKKGDNPFKNRQQEQVKSRASTIKGYLESIPSGVSFEDINALIRYVVDKVGCARSTIVRQKKYMNLIAEEFATRNASIESIDLNHATQGEYKKLIEYYKAKIATLKGDFARKEKYYKSENYISELQLTDGRDLMLPDNSEATNDNRYQKKYESVCFLLENLLTHTAKVGITLDQNNKAIVDDGYGTKEVLIPNNVVSKDRMTPFIEYLERK